MNREEDLVKSIALLGKQLDNGNSCEPPSQNVIEKFNTLKRDLEKIIEYRIKGAILNEGEKNTKYFLNLECRHFKQEI